MADWIELSNTDTDGWEGEVKVFTVNNRPVAVFRLEDGFYAIDDTCSHAEASLADGEIEDGCIECPLHGALFDIRSGKNLSFPAVTPVRSYPLKIEGGKIFIQV